MSARTECRVGLLAVASLRKAALCRSGESECRTGSPITTAGRVGVRGDSTNFNVDDFRVVAAV